MVGVEVLNFAADLPLDALVGRFHFPAADAELVLRQIRPSIQHSVSSVGSGQGLRGGAPVANTKSKQR